MTRRDRRTYAMRTMTKAIRTELRSFALHACRWARHETGAVATEYGLLLLLISLTIILAATAFGASLSGLFDQGTAGFPAGGSGS
jgi:Flp pilus assembly pilin Flp